MRIPTDIPLATWIRQLIADNRLIVFYKSKEWIELKNEVMQENHFECQECLERGRVSRADCVHHVIEVRKNPSLALSKTYVDAYGNEHKQLVPLCNACHNQAHNRFDTWNKEHGKEKFMNEEKW